MNIVDALDFYAYERYPLFRQYDYTPPPGGFINNDQTEYNAITWGDELEENIPIFFFMNEEYPRIARYQAARRAGEKVPGMEVAISDLETDVSTIQTTLGGLATVATSGSYNDLSDKPTLPSLTPQAHINDAAANAATNAPTNLNVLTTLLGSLTGEVNATNTKQNDLATKYNDLANKFNTLLDKLEANNLLSAS